VVDKDQKAVKLTKSLSNKGFSSWNYKMLSVVFFSIPITYLISDFS